MTNSLTINKLSFSYGKKNILNELNLKCENGIHALLGNNGAGKSTLMNILTGMLKPSQGKIMLNDIDLLRMKKYPLQFVGYLPQQFDTYAQATGYDFLKHIYSLKQLPQKKTKEAIEQVIEKFNLQTVIHKKFGSYSGGFKRRLGIAQAYLGEPKLILIDEPTVGLDPEQRADFRQYLLDQSASAITIISTHIIEDVELYSNQVAILKNKQFEAVHTVDEIIAQARPHILAVDLQIADYIKTKEQLKVIEQKRISSERIRLLYMKNDTPIPNSYEPKEVSLENAYVYFQKK